MKCCLVTMLSLILLSGAYAGQFPRKAAETINYKFTAKPLEYQSVTKINPVLNRWRTTDSPEVLSFNKFIKNSELNNKENNRSGWIIPITITLTAGLAFYTVYSVRGR